MAFANPKRNIEQFMLEPGMEVADFGAGSGHLAVEAAEVVGREGTVYVIDIQRDLLTKATHIAKEHHLESLVFIHADLETPKGSTLPDGSVDAVIISNILFQVTAKEVVMQEAFRILRENGRVLVVDWSDSFGNIGPHPDQVFLEADARALAERVGFTYLADIDTGAYHYGIILQKHG
jgi:ubiquinone/menaquinone biosynthesis C-methylase UbiE